MSAVLLSGHNYFSTDPNRSLSKKLNECANWIDLHIYRGKKPPVHDLRCTGSEKFIPEWENKMDVSFTSPPYFNLEKYSEDDSMSTINYNNYDLWVQNFVIPSVKNIYSYLKVGGYGMINIKNLSDKEPCFDAYFDAFKSIDGFEYIETFEMTFGKKCYAKQYSNTKGVIDNHEPVMSFRKIK